MPRSDTTLKVGMMRTSTGSISVTKIIQKKKLRNGKRKSTMANEAMIEIAISIIASFAIVYFRFPLRNFFFWMIFVTLMLPIEVRIIPTFKVASDLHLLDSYMGLTLPLIASATATFLFRQFFLTIPDELAEASRIDGAGPMRFFFDVVLPL